MFSGDAYGVVSFSDHDYTPPDTSAFIAFLQRISQGRCWVLEVDAFSLATVDAVSSAFGSSGFGELGFADDTSGSTGGTVTLRWSSHGYTSTAADSPASTWMDGRLQRVVVDRQIVGRDGIGGTVAVSAEVILNNQDGGMDEIPADYALDGRPARLYIGDPDAAFSTFGLVFTGVAQTLRPDMTQAVLVLTDGVGKLNRNIQETVYAGTGGLEGGDDLKGKPKPLCWGSVKNVAPPLVTSASLVYQVHDGVINDVPAAYDRGVALTKVVGVPAAGQYSVNTTQGTITLGATPAGTVTCDVQGDASGSGYVNKTGSIVRRILSNQADLTSSEIDPTSFAQLDVDASAEVGIWIGTEPRLISEVVDELLYGVGAFGGFSRLGSFTVGVVADATGEIVDAAFTEEHIRDLVREVLPGPVQPIVWRALVGYQRNYTVQDDLAASVTAAVRTFAAEPIRVAKDEDTAVQSRYLLARELRVDGYYAQSADASTEAARLLDLWGVRRALFTVTLPIEAMLRELGQVVTLAHSRMGLADAPAGRVIGYRVDDMQVELRVLV